MAEFVMKDLLAKAERDDVEVESAALHDDAIGCDVHRGTKRELSRHGIPFSPRNAWRLTAKKASEYDLVVGMDGANMDDLRWLVGAAERPVCRRLLDFSPLARDVADPWYTGDFEATYADIAAGCACLLEQI